jgi:hypothetical protein
MFVKAQGPNQELKQKHAADAKAAAGSGYSRTLCSDAWKPREPAIPAAVRVR